MSIALSLFDFFIVLFLSAMCRHTARLNASRWIQCTNAHIRNRRCLAKMPTTPGPRLSRSSQQGKPSPNVPNRRPRFPTSTPPPEPSTHHSGFSIRSQQDSALAFGSAIPSAFRPRPSKQSFSAATHRFQPNDLHGSRSYPRRHGVQFRRAHVLYHNFRHDGVTAENTDNHKTSCDVQKQMQDSLAFSP